MQLSWRSRLGDRYIDGYDTLISEWVSNQRNADNDSSDQDNRCATDDDDLIEEDADEDAESEPDSNMFDVEET